MSNGNDGNQWNEGYTPPGGSMAEEQMRAARDAERRQQQEWDRQQREDLARQERADRVQREQNARNQRTQQSKRQPHSKQAHNSKRQYATKNAKAKPETYFSNTGAILGFLAAGGYSYFIHGNEAIGSIILGLLGGAVLGYTFKYVIALGILVAIYYIFFKDDSSKSKFGVAPMSDPIYQETNRLENTSNTDKQFVWNWLHPRQHSDLV